MLNGFSIRAKHTLCEVFNNKLYVNFDSVNTRMVQRLWGFSYIPTGN